MIVLFCLVGFPACIELMEDHMETSTPREPLSSLDRAAIYGAMAALLFFGLAIGYRIAITDWTVVARSWSLDFCS